MKHETIQWLYDLRHFGVKLGLDNIRALLEVLGRPQEAYPILHIAGTNGKGSVAAMLDAMLAAHGVRSGMFSSPHLVRPNERIRIAGEDIPDEQLHRALASMRDVIRGGLSRKELDVHPSFFEVVTATALQTFRERGLEAAVLEVGLGGRLDATNVVDPEVCVVVSIALDHTKTLGGTLEKISAEKAGIVKHGTPVVSGVVQQAAIDVLQAVCAERGAELIDARVAAWLVDEDDDSFAVETSLQRYPGLRLTIPGRHQLDNARVALVAFERFMHVLGKPVEPDAVREGLAGVRWPGRLQWIDGSPGFLLDAAHNMAGVRTLTDYLQRQSIPRPVLLFGATSGKPIGEMLAALAKHTVGAVLTRPPLDRGLDPHELQHELPEGTEPVEVVPDVGQAIECAKKLAGPDGAVLVTGSLYLVGQVLGQLRNEPVTGPVAM